MTRSSPADDSSNVQCHRSFLHQKNKNKFSLHSQSLLTLFLFFIPYFGATVTPLYATWCNQQWFLQKPFLHSKYLDVVFLSTKFTRLHQIHCSYSPPFRNFCVWIKFLSEITVVDNYKACDFISVFSGLVMFVTGSVNACCTFSWSINSLAKMSANSTIDTLQKPLQCLFQTSFYVSLSIIPNIVV